MPESFISDCVQFMPRLAQCSLQNAILWLWNTTGIWLHVTSARSWCWNSIWDHRWLYLWSYLMFIVCENELLKQNYHFCTVRETVECALTQLIIHLSLQNILSSTHWSLWWIGCVQLKGGNTSSKRKTQRASWSQDRAGWLTQVMVQPLRLLEKLKIKSRNCHISFGRSPESLIAMWYEA